MYNIFKFTAGFLGIILLGIVGVAVSEAFRLGDMNAFILTIDNIARIR